MLPRSTPLYFTLIRIHLVANVRTNFLAQPPASTRLPHTPSIVVRNQGGKEWGYRDDTRAGQRAGMSEALMPRPWRCLKRKISITVEQWHGQRQQKRTSGKLCGPWESRVRAAEDEREDVVSAGCSSALRQVPGDARDVEQRGKGAYEACRVRTGVVSVSVASKALKGPDAQRKEWRSPFQKIQACTAQAWYR